MIVASLAFYLFAVIAVVSALNVIFQRNPVHSVLWLILTFFNAAGLFVLLGAEFIAMILVVVYVGAVAVLFLFVVMMLDINITVSREGFLKYLPVGALIGIILLVELAVVFGGWSMSPGAEALRVAPTPAISELTNTEALGSIFVHRLRLFVSGRRSGFVGGHDRRHCSDPSPPPRCAEAEDF